MKKKLFLVVVAVVMFVGIINVYALTTNNETSASDPNSHRITDTATLTVENVRGVDHFNAYKILNAYYNSSTNVVSYEFTDDFQTFLDQSSSYQNFTVDEYFSLTSGDITSGSTISTSTADKLMSSYATYIRVNNITGTAMDKTVTTATATLQAGSYLVLPEVDSENERPLNIYAVMLGNLDVTASSGVWVVNDETIVVKTADIDFTFNVGDESDVIEGHTDRLSFSIGEKFPFELIGRVPDYPTNATNKTYTFEVNFYSGQINLESELGSIVVKDGNTTLTTSDTGVVTNTEGNTVATITMNEGSEPGNQILRIEFNVDYLTGKEVTIQGEASLTEQAQINLGNFFDVILIYSNDPYGTETNSIYDVFFLYTYNLTVLKYDSKDEIPMDTPLANAMFDIYSDQELQNKVGTVTTGDDGRGVFSGLKYGTYYLKETKAPTGYQLVEDPIKVDVGDVKISTRDSSRGYAYVPNVKMGLLPVTGSTGIILFTCIGVLIVGTGVGLLVYYKKKKKKEQNIEVV